MKIKYAFLGLVAIVVVFAAAVAVQIASETPEQKARWAQVLQVRDGCRAALLEKMGAESADLSMIQMQASGKDSVGQWNYKRADTMIRIAGSAYQDGKPLDVAKAETLASMKDEGTIAQKYAPRLAACIYREAAKQ